MPDELAQLTDQQLLSRLAEGEEAILKYYFDLHYSKLCAHALKYVRIEEISEEIVQEIFVNFWERRKELKVSGSVAAYLYTAVRYRCINYIKNQLPKEQAMTESIDLADEVRKDFDSEIELQGLKDRLQRSILDLPEKCRIIFLLAKEDGLTYKEIAEELDISEKTVENQMGIALKKLRGALRPKGQGKMGVLNLLILFRFYGFRLGVLSLFNDL